MEIVETYKDKWGHINYICNCERCGGDAHYRRKISGPSICLVCAKKEEKRKARERYLIRSEYICDEICRHPRECTSQEELDEICVKCRFGGKK